MDTTGPRNAVSSLERCPYFRGWLYTKYTRTGLAVQFAMHFVCDCYTKLSDVAIFFVLIGLPCNWKTANQLQETKVYYWDLKRFPYFRGVLKRGAIIVLT